MGFRAQPMRTITSGLSVLAAALMLNATAYAASGALDPCDQADRNLKSLEVPVTALTVDVVDHVLGQFNDREAENLAEFINRVSEAAVRVLCDGVNAGMNQFNRKSITNF